MPYIRLQAAEASAVIKQVQDEAQAEIDSMLAERTNNLQTIAALRREIDNLQQNQACGMRTYPSCASDSVTARAGGSAQ